MPHCVGRDLHKLHVYSVVYVYVVLLVDNAEAWLCIPEALPFRVERPP